MGEGKTILVLGGGFGGLAFVNEFRRLEPGGHRLVLVSDKDRFSLGACNLWLMVGERGRPEECERSIRGITRKGVEFIHDEVTHIDPRGRRVRTRSHELAADYIVIALGAGYDMGLIPGLSRAAYNLYDLGDAYRLQKALAGFRRGKIVISVAKLPFKCPSAPYEAALLIDYLMRSRGVRGEVEIELYTPEHQPMPAAGPEVGAAVRRMLEERGIGYYTEYDGALLKVDAESRRALFELTETRFDLLISVPPHSPPEPVKRSGMLDPTGWIPVDPYTLETEFEGVYAVGDVTSIVLKNGMQLPKAGVFAEAQARVVARNILSELSGSPGNERFDGYGYCYLDVGWGKAAYGEGYFYEDPAPRVKLEPPSEEYRRRKEEFEAHRLSTWP